MAESAQYINSLVETSPSGDDYKYDGAAHMRVVKSAVKNTFANINGAVSVTPAEMNYLSGVSTNVQTQIQTLSATAYSIAGRLADLESIGGVASISYSANQTYINAGRDTTPKHWGSYAISYSNVATITGNTLIQPSGTLINESTLSLVNNVSTIPRFTVPSGVTQAKIYGQLIVKGGVTETINSIGTYPLDVAYGNDIYVGIFNGNKIYTSPDFYSWTDASASISSCSKIAFGNGTFVIAGSGIASGSTIAYSSTNGTTWTNRTFISITGGASVNDLSYVNNKFIMFVIEDLLLAESYEFYSSDGITWAQATLPSTTAWYRSPLYVNGRYLAFPYNGGYQRISSSDGISWSAGGTTLTYGVNGSTFGKNIYVLGGQTPEALYSNDGDTWVSASTSSFSLSPRICFDGDAFLLEALESGVGFFLRKSTDGINWATIHSFNANHSRTGKFIRNKGVIYLTGYNPSTSDPLFYNKKKLPGVLLSDDSATIDDTLRLKYHVDNNKYKNSSFDVINFEFKETSVTYGQNLFVSLTTNGPYNYELTATGVAGSWVGVEFR